MSFYFILQNKHPKISQPQYKKNVPITKYKNNNNTFRKAWTENKTSNKEPIGRTTNHVSHDKYKRPQNFSANFGRLQNVRIENETRNHQSWLWEYNSNDHTARSRDCDHLSDQTFKNMIFEISMLLSISSLRTQNLDYATYTLFSYIDNNVLQDIIHHKFISHRYITAFDQVYCSRPLEFEAKYALDS